MDDAEAAHPAILRRPVTRVTGRSRETFTDALAVERALEIRIAGRALAVTLRTPGDDLDLVRGFLASEGVIARRDDIEALHEHAAACADEADVIDVTLANDVTLDWRALERNFAATAACGLCGRVHVDALRAGLTRAPITAPLSRERLLALPETLRAGQTAFAETGGLHAAVWCDAELSPQVLREDVGRHNAVDKVCGALLDSGQRPASPGVLWVSGRAGAELVLKAARAGIGVMAAVGAPSSLAVTLAKAAGMTLIGFLREGRMNIYTGEEGVL